jgi:creatinine amidohydrolase
MRRWSVPELRARDLNWMQVEEYLGRDDRVVLPLGSTEQHGFLSLETDNILAERVSAEAAEPLGVLVLPVLPYGLTPSFASFPGSPTLRLATFVEALRDLLDSLHGQGFRRFLLVNGHGGNLPAGSLVREWATAHPDAQAIFHSWWSSERVQAAAREIDPEPSHANWFENFPWTRVAGVELPSERKPPLDEAAYRAAGPGRVRELLGDGVFEGAYELPDERVEQVWRAGVDEVRELLENGWR